MNMKFSYYLRVILFEIRCFIHNVIFCPQVLIRKNIHCRHSFLKNVKFHIASNSKVVINNTILRDCTFFLFDDGCLVDIGDGCRIKKLKFYCEDTASSITISKNTTIGGGEFAATEGVSITIGSDCMFSEDVEIRNGDSHSITSLTTPPVRLNKAKDVVIGNHVWVAAHTRILKGATLPDNCVLANSSVLSSAFVEKNAIYGGIPAKLLKSGINWNRNRNL